MAVEHSPESILGFPHSQDTPGLAPLAAQDMGYGAKGARAPFRLPLASWKQEVSRQPSSLCCLPGRAGAAV